MNGHLVSLLGALGARVMVTLLWHVQNSLIPRPTHKNFGMRLITNLSV